MRFLFFITLLFVFVISSCRQIPENQNESFDPESFGQSMLEEYLKLDGDASSFRILDFTHLQLTYADVRPIIANNCLHCHSENGHAPFRLDDYDSVKKKSLVIKDVLASRLMPPWMAEGDHSEFFNAPEITDSARSVIVNWINQGCKRGTDFSLSDLRSNIGGDSRELKPSQTITLNHNHVITSNSDTYQCFIFDPKLSETENLIGVRFSSNNPEVIHHITMYLDTAGYISATDSCWDCMNDDVVNKLLPVNSWSRGMRPIIFDSGIGYRIHPGQRFILQIHYGDEGYKGREERTTLELFYRDTLKYEAIFDVVNRFDFFYPAGQVTYEYLVKELSDSISLLGLIPHSHFLCRKMKCFAITPENKLLNLLSIPVWDYLWQGQYILKVPQIIPKGSKIYFFEVIDNTENNPVQPNYPVRDVLFGTRSVDEMLTLVLLHKKYALGDEELRVASYIN